jgi:NADH-quinone oxidoreductase subunit N
LLVSFLSLGGIPPFGGFVAKVLVFASAAQVNLIWLVIIGLLNSIVALYYYLVVIRTVYQGRSEDESRPLAISRPWKIALTVCIAGVVLMGFIIGPVFGWSQAAATALF